MNLAAIGPAILAVMMTMGCVVGDDDADLLSDAADGDVNTYDAALSWPSVSQGAQGEDVVALQYLLRARGYTLSVDGSFGATTRSAVIAFQRATGLSADGVVGGATWPALTLEVKRGSTSDAVRAVQYLLQRRFGQSLDVTGEFGPTTEARTKAMQASVCLGQTGVIGRYTWNSLITRRSYCSGSGSDASKLVAMNQSGRITLWDQTFGRFDGADPQSNITDTAAGRRAKTSCYGNAPCTTVQLSARMLSGMVALRERYGFDYFVTAIAGATHSAGSYHYAGRALDIDQVNGVRINGDSSTSRALMNACVALGAIEVLGPSNDSGHQDHVHCAW